VCDDEEREDEPFVVPIEEAIDLHVFAPREVRSAVEAYLEAAAEKGYREVRLIHGRGKGVQRASIRQLLERHPLVDEFFDAPPGRGGWGATLVRLREPK
jgi:DNA-nicking Smr family endonuclease